MEEGLFFNKLINKVVFYMFLVLSFIGFFFFSVWLREIFLLLVIWLLRLVEVFYIFSLGWSGRFFFVLGR